MAYFIIPLILLIAGVNMSLGSNWSYSSPDHWSDICKSGKSQSPINLDREDADEAEFNPFQFEHYNNEYNASMKNNGHSVVIRFDKSPSGNPTVRGAGLPEEYTLDHLHFHWQSEHTIVSRRFPLEMHLVHFATKHKDVPTAAQFPNGIAVLGVLFDESSDDDSDFQPLIEVMSNIEHTPNKVVQLDKLIKPKHFLPRDKGGFYRYYGSLTTPECNEVVIWTVFTNTLRVSNDQINHFKSVYSAQGPLTLNYRPVQPINGRSILLKRSPIHSGQSPLTISYALSILSVLLISTVSF